MTQPTIAARMAALYARLPRVACQRKCQDACGSTVFQFGAMTTFEYSRATFGGTTPIPMDDPLTHCVFLSRGGDCTIYAQRPLVCRLWGAGVGVECPHGCQPERWITREEADALFREAEAIGGGTTEAFKMFVRARHGREMP